MKRGDIIKTKDNMISLLISFYVEIESTLTAAKNIHQTLISKQQQFSQYDHDAVVVLIKLQDQIVDALFPVVNRGEQHAEETNASIAPDRRRAALANFTQLSEFETHFGARAAVNADNDSLIKPYKRLYTKLRETATKLSKHLVADKSWIGSALSYLSNEPPTSQMYEPYAQLFSKLDNPENIHAGAQVIDTIHAVSSSSSATQQENTPSILSQFEAFKQESQERMRILQNELHSYKQRSETKTANLGAQLFQTQQLLEDSTQQVTHFQGQMQLLQTQNNALEQTLTILKSQRSKTREALEKEAYIQGRTINITQADGTPLPVGSPKMDAYTFKALSDNEMQILKDQSVERYQRHIVGRCLSETQFALMSKLMELYKQQGMGEVHKPILLDLVYKIFAYQSVPIKQLSKAPEIIKILATLSQQLQTELTKFLQQILAERDDTCLEVVPGEIITSGQPDNYANIIESVWYAASRGKYLPSLRSQADVEKKITQNGLVELKVLGIDVSNQRAVHEATQSTSILGGLFQ